MDHGVDIDALIRETGSGSPGGKPFGWQANRDKDTIREQLILEGLDPGGHRLYFETERRYTELRKHDLTYSQRQDLARWLGLPWVAPRQVASPRAALNRDEVAYLVERLAGVNEPLGVSAAAKLRAMLDHQ